MGDFFVVLVVAVIAVGFMMLGLAITLIRKGRPMQGDVGDNDEMKKRGLKCASQQFRQEEIDLRGGDSDFAYSCHASHGACSNDGSCGSCGDVEIVKR